MGDDTVLRQIAELPKLPIDALRERWRILYGNEPPNASRDYLVRRLAYRIQELAFGGLDDDARRRLKGLAGQVNARTFRRNRSKRMANLPVAGTRLVREWNGDRYEALVTGDGFEYSGRPYRSLTAIAKAITGTHWNGRVFFGLTKPKAQRQEARS